MGVGTLTFLRKKPYGIDYTLYTLTKGQVVSSMITVTSTVTNNKKTRGHQNDEILFSTT